MIKYKSIKTFRCRKKIIYFQTLRRKRFIETVLRSYIASCPQQPPTRATPLITDAIKIYNPTVHTCESFTSFWWKLKSAVGNKARRHDITTKIVELIW